MSTARLTDRERALYLIGKAITQTLEAQTALLSEKRIVLRWIEEALGGEELRHVVIHGTGVIPGDEEPKPADLSRLSPLSGREDQNHPEIPF